MRSKAQKGSKLEKIKRIKSLRREQLKRRVATGLAVTAMVAVMASVFVVPVSQIRESVASLFGSKDFSAMGASEVLVTNSSDGLGLSIDAKSDSGVRKIEAFVDSDKVFDESYSGSGSSVRADVPFAIPFGETKEVSVRVNGAEVFDESIENLRYIANAQDMCTFRDIVNGGNNFAGKIVELTADIDLSSVCYRVDGTAENDVSWMPIKTFSGTFNGNYYKIESLYYNSNNGDYMVGLFSQNNGIIERTNLKNVYLNNRSNLDWKYLGAMVATNNGNGTVLQCGVISGTIERI